MQEDTIEQRIDVLKSFMAENGYGEDDYQYKVLDEYTDENGNKFMPILGRTVKKGKPFWDSDKSIRDVSV